MNLFTTDHPMSSNGSWFDASEFPRLSIVLKVLVGTLILVPFVFLRLYQWVISDIGANSFEPFPALAWGLIAAFALSLPSACTAVFVYQFIARRSKGKTNAA
jgi:hypothetical protein